MSLPKPFIKYIPKMFADNPDAATLALCSKADEQIELWFKNTKAVGGFCDPVKMPVQALNEAGYMLSAGLRQDDTEAQKRYKLATATDGHKKRGRWDADAKPKVDVVTGTDSEIYNVYGVDPGTTTAWLVRGQIAGERNDYMAALGRQIAGDDYGILLLGTGAEPEIAGNIYIDTKTSSLTQDQVAQIAENLRADTVPVYMRIYIGYMDGDVFVVYSGGTLN